MNKYKVIYNNRGKAYSDFEVEDVVRKSISNYKNFREEYDVLGDNTDYEIRTSTENVLTIVRLVVAEGELNYEDVVIVYENKEYYLDKYGAYKEVFTLENCQQKLLDRILQANFKMEELG